LTKDPPGMMSGGLFHAQAVGEAGELDRRNLPPTAISLRSTNLM